MEYDKDRVIVVGAGVIGLCSAYHLLKAGRPVTIIDSSKSEYESCSYGNAGMVVPSHFIPLAAPGMVSKGLKMLANPEGPFYIRPRTSIELMRWCKLFMAHCTNKHTMDSRELLRDMHLQSRRLFLDMAGDTGVDIVEPEEPEEEDVAPGSRRVSRGGIWDSSARNARCASRWGSMPSSRYPYLGLRTSRSLPASS